MEYTKGDWYSCEEEPEAILCIEEGKDSPTDIAKVFNPRANAQLISAAPDLYEALKDAIETIHAFHGDVAWEIYFNEAPEMQRYRKALAKAEGN